MSAKISRCRLILDTRRALKDGSYPVKISVPYSKDLLISTGISVSSCDWTGDAYTGPQAKAVNSLLNAQLARISGRVQDLKDRGKLHGLPPATLRKALEAEDPETVIGRDTRPDIIRIAEAFIALKKPGSTRDLYLRTLDKVKAYIGGKTVHVDDLDRVWLTGFEASIGGKVNARAVHLRNLRAICNFALDEDYTSYYPFRKFKIKTEETRKRALTIEQLRAIRDLDCEPWQREHRDMFMLIFYLIGVNPADIFTAGPEALRNGRLEYRRAKTGRLYSIKVEPEAMEILERYRGKRFLLSALDRYKDYKDYLHHVNDALKTLGMDARWGVKRKGKAIEPGLSCYWARHTWATIAAELDISDPTISLALGHATAGHRTTAVYIKRNDAKIDEANRKVIDFLNGDR